jgi:hypothetical protein
MTSIASAPVTTDVPGLQSFSPATRIRAGGAALVAGGALCIVGGTLHPIVDGKSHSVAALTAPFSPIAQVLLAVGTVLLILGLPVLHGWLDGRIGRLGSVGLLAYLLGNLVTAGAHLVVEVFVAHPLAADPATAGLISDDDSMLGTVAFDAVNQVGGIVMLAGMAALGVGLLRSGAVPRWIGVLTTAGMVGFFLPIPPMQFVAGLLYEGPRGLAVIALGVLMVRSAGGSRSAE